LAAPLMRRSRKIVFAETQPVCWKYVSDNQWQRIGWFHHPQSTQTLSYDKANEWRCSIVSIFPLAVARVAGYSVGTNVLQRSWIYAPMSGIEDKSVT
jgi:hypothetical protein